MLSPRDCRRLIWLTLLMTLGALLEIIGIGLLLPLMAAVTDPELFDSWSCLQYFQQFSKMEYPVDCEPFGYELQHLQNYKLLIDNYTAADMKLLP